MKNAARFAKRKKKKRKHNNKKTKKSTYYTLFFVSIWNLTLYLYNDIIYISNLQSAKYLKNGLGCRFSKEVQVKKKVVQFIALTEVAGLGWVAICQQRNSFNSEDPSGYKKQSYANAYQLTFSEKGEVGEEARSIKIRGAKEELGRDAAETLLMAEKDSAPILTDELEDKIVYTYVAIVPSTILKEIRTEVSATIKLIPRQDVSGILPLTPEDKNGVSTGEIKMFSDAIKALKKAFEMA